MKGISQWGLPQKRLALAAALLLPPLTAAYLMQLAFGVLPWQFPLLAALGNAICLGALYYLLCALTGRWVISALVLHLAGGVWGALNYFVCTFRGTPILPCDLLALETAAAVSDTYTFSPTLPMVAALVVVAVLTVVLLTRVGTGRVSPRLRGRCLAACAVCLIPVLHPPLLSHFGIGTNVWDQPSGYRSGGVLGSFLGNTTFLQVEKPEGLNAEHLAQLLPTAEAASDTLNDQHEGPLPNILVIMNESWADYEGYGNLNLNLNLPVTSYISSLDNAVWGHAYSPVFGAGTSACEFEFLTGNSMAFLPAGSAPYQQYIREPAPSLAWTLRQSGYDTLAFHPGERNSWQRDRAYPLLGFEDYLCGEDMDVPREIVHGFVSDRADFDQVIYSFEHKDPDKPLFLFNVTIQNHGGYDNETYEAQVHLTDCPGKFPLAEQYLSLARETDLAFQKLVDYFSQQEEPTIVLMFGDHQPSVEQEFLDLAYGVKQEDMTMEEYMGKFRVPYVIWANYPLDPDVTVQDTSLNFLSQALMDYAGLEGDQYFQYLGKLQETVPVVSFPGYQDPQGNAYSHLETTPLTALLEDYQCLQYQRLFGLEDTNDTSQ